MLGFVRLEADYSLLACRFMTDAEWKTCDFPCAMLEALFDQPHCDKFRRLACQWCLLPEVRRLLESQRASEFITSAEQYVARQISSVEFSDAVHKAPKAWVSRGWGHRPVKIPPAAQALRAVASLAAPDAWEAAWGVATEAVNFLGLSACDIVREAFDAPAKLG